MHTNQVWTLSLVSLETCLSAHNWLCASNRHVKYYFFIITGRASTYLVTSSYACYLSVFADWYKSLLSISYNRKVYIHDLRLKVNPHTEPHSSQNITWLETDHLKSHKYPCFTASGHSAASLWHSETRKSAFCIAHSAWIQSIWYDILAASSPGKCKDMQIQLPKDFLLTCCDKPVWCLKLGALKQSGHEQCLYPLPAACRIRIETGVWNSSWLYFTHVNSSYNEVKLSIILW